MKNILITGGAGYIGSHVAHDLIEAGNDVTIFDNLSTGSLENVHPGSSLVEGDICNSSDLTKLNNKQFDVIFHFAAWKAAGESMITPSKYSQNNISGTLRLLNFCEEQRISKFIFSSSAAVYGSPQYIPIDEDHPKVPENYYGYTKLAIEENLKWYSKLKGIKYAALRYFNATGYDVKKRIKAKETNPANLSPIIMETAAGIRKKMLVFGNDYNTPDGTCIRDYIHVNDLSTAHILAMHYLFDTEKDLTVNLGTSSGASVLEMINAASEVTGSKINYEIVERRNGDPANLIASSALANKLLNWKPVYSNINNIFESMKYIYSLK
ncbi:MAG: UDP-glucose 4-epimerase GalE [Ignavibacteriaceae bacterium]|nr:UDP-glucose 4-epimerase GalE [Ignavibacteriaceae bacterium]